ncbi:MAG: lipoyl synthase [Syntrophorhabdaceae bacterium]|nr:lipoyl synthase [Syntrophorhabdaceae bacterium]
MTAPTRKPEWLKIRAPYGEKAAEVSGILRRYGLRTVCRDARCPNVGECWGVGAATVILLGELCTRGCAFCGIASGAPAPPDFDEPDRLAKAAAELGWRHVVLTSVTRDDLSDGGAAHFAASVLALRKSLPSATIELLTPDFAGSVEALRTVVDAAPDILSHNVETVPRLYPYVRKGAAYARSIELIRNAASMRPGLPLKSGIMVGLGETQEEVVAVFHDLRGAGCGMLTVGQYLPPTKRHFPLVEYLPPERFEAYAEIAREIGFENIRSGPLVRSSYKP